MHNNALENPTCEVYTVKLSYKIPKTRIQHTDPILIEAMNNKIKTL